MATIAERAGMAHAQLARLEAEGKLDEGLRCEILHGELVIRGAPHIRHERVVRTLMTRFAAWVDRNGGEAFTSVGIEIGGQQLVPDLSFIGPDRADELDADGFRVPPDVVGEVTSPGTRSLDLDEKVRVYAEIGVAEYWVVDLAEQRVRVHHLTEPGGAYEAHDHADGTLTTAQAPGLEVAVAELTAAG